MICAVSADLRRYEQQQEKDIEYAEELEARALALMKPGQPCDPDAPKNLEFASTVLDTDDQAEIFEFWYDAAAARAADDMTPDPDRFRD